MSKLCTTLDKLQTLHEFCALTQFARSLSEEDYFSQGFEIFELEVRESMVRAWVKGAGGARKDAAEFFARFIPFASANGGGSFYALWINDSTKPLNQLPVVVFGDEGGVFVVAENFVQLLHLLTYDEEISVSCANGESENPFFLRYRYEESGNLPYYLQWVKQAYGLNPITEAEETGKIISAAQGKYTAGFNAWFSQYYDLNVVGIEPWA